MENQTVERSVASHGNRKTQPMFRADIKFSIPQFQRLKTVRPETGFMETVAFILRLFLVIIHLHLPLQFLFKFPSCDKCRPTIMRYNLHNTNHGYEFI
jgi:hypothetical protein